MISFGIHWWTYRCFPGARASRELLLAFARTGGSICDYVLRTLYE